MHLHKVHHRNTERHTGEFDIVAEQGALERLCKNTTVQVAHVLGDCIAVASHGGVVTMVPARQLLGTQEPIADTHMVYFWHGKLYNPTYKRVGRPFSYGPYANQFYHRDRVAEILSRQKEALK